ncbi:MAG: hypothetical protein N2043_00675 [Ignavibacterium sp.]|nr:hypothetical protein [Ignavibacterium sp.]
MNFRDQEKYLDYLRRCEKKFTPKELEEYKMFVKRQKDGEEFDSLSMKRLKELYDKYYEKKDISKLDELFKKK